MSATNQKEALSFDEVYRSASLEPDQFWMDAAADIEWLEQPPKAQGDNSLDALTGKWFKGGKLNSCYNALDVHVKNGFGDQSAIIYESPVTGVSEIISYSELLSKVAVFAGALRNKGIKKGDRVVIYMPMIPQAVIAILACARIGAIHSVVFGGFASNELAVRIDDAKPKAIISASCGVELTRIIDYKGLLDQAVRLAEYKPEIQVVFQRKQKIAELDKNGDVDWFDFIEGSSPIGCEILDATDPLYILYTSGTTGKPKGVIRDNGGHCVALKWSMRNIYNMQPGQVFWAASDIGWVVGHSYIIYGPLFNRNTTVLYEGKPIGTPDCNAFWRVIEKHKVATLFTAPTAIRAIKKEDPLGEKLEEENIDLGSLQALFLAGERSDPDTLKWAEEQLRVPVIDHWWQTETGWSICANCLGIEQLAIKHGSPTKPVPGYQLQVLGKEGEVVETGKIGALAIKTPLPPGTFAGLWENESRFRQGYFARYPGYYETGDAGYVDENGYVYVMARTDDIINVAGHRLSTGAIEEVIASHPSVAECAVIGVPCGLKGEKPMALIVLNNDSGGKEPVIQSETVQMVREQLGAVYSYKSSIVVSGLPKTRSGKVLRGTMKQIAKGESYQMPATIENAKVLESVEAEIKASIN